ncbi:6348_t:CDS:10 [Diversispora eburnea]|uniref:6348_t:CDS:1 n=1 Tax=Diversispora eburnea TaxID=1213867 RepID=A0A9N9AWS1_9GLOM|nr:6348_t:CDS:10 [Diversispora eburnea]
MKFSELPELIKKLFQKFEIQKVFSQEVFQLQLPVEKEPVYKLDPNLKTSYILINYLNDKLQVCAILILANQNQADQLIFYSITLTSGKVINNINGKEPTMEILKKNFHDLLPIIQEAIKDADFIALDTELTGLNEHIERIKSFDDPQSRYTKVRKAASKARDHYVLGNPISYQNDICFMCSGSSLHFLMNCGFDFNKLISQGIPFINNTDEVKLTQRKADLAQRQIVLSAESKPKSILFERLTEAQKEKKVKIEVEEALAASLNFRTIIELLIESKKPLVGHNCFLDICQLVQQFWMELPEKLREWKKLVHGLFSTIIDTKHIAATHRKLQTLIPKNGVQDILQIVQTEPFESLSPKIELDPRFTRYIFNDESQNHEAGYDAFITGYNFIRLAVFILHEKEEKVDVYDYFFNEYSTENTNENNSGESFEIDFPVDHLKEKTLVERPPTKPNGFLVSNIPSSCNQVSLYTLFGDFGNIFFQWIDDTHCWLIVKDDKKVNKVPKGKLGQTKLFSLFLEGGERYQLGQEKGITKEMGEIFIQSWSNWINALQDAEAKDEKDEKDICENQYHITSMDDNKNIHVEEIEFEIEPFPIPHDDNTSWEHITENTSDNWTADTWANGEDIWAKKEINWSNEGDDIENTEDKRDNWDITLLSDSETLSMRAKRTLSTPQLIIKEEESDSEMNGAFKKTRIE